MTALYVHSLFIILPLDSLALSIGARIDLMYKYIMTIYMLIFD